MYQLVADVHAYQEFLPWCHSASAEPIDEHRVQAKLAIHKSGIDLSFTTINTHTPHKSIAMEFTDGPFHRLNGLWTFEPLGEEGCRVSLEVDFEVAKGMRGTLVGKVFKAISSSLVDAFVQRSQQVYG